jgi:hypothetical protein
MRIPVSIAFATIVSPRWVRVRPWYCAKLLGGFCREMGAVVLFQADLGAGAYSPEIEADSNKLISGEVRQALAAFTAASRAAPPSHAPAVQGGDNVKTAYEKARHEEGLQLEAFFQEVREIRDKMAQIRRNVGEIETKHQEALKQTDVAKAKDLSQELARLDDDAQLGVQEVKRRLKLMKSDADALVLAILCGAPKGVLGAKAQRLRKARKGASTGGLAAACNPQHAACACCMLRGAYCMLRVACCVLHRKRAPTGIVCKHAHNHRASRFRLDWIAVGAGSAR